MIRDRTPSLTRRHLLKALGAAATTVFLPACGSSSGNGNSNTVLIVGAGMAGLTAANALRNAGIPCILIEARDRIGGRLWTQDVGGIPIDLGGAWIHTPVGNPMTAFADQAGIAYDPVNPLQDPLAINFYEEGTGALSEAEALQGFLGYEGFDGTLGKWSRQLGTGASVHQGIEAYLDSFNPAAVPRARMEHICRFVHESFDSGSWDDISLEYLAHSPIDPYAGDEFGNFPRGGYINLVNAMANGADVRLNHRVTRIAYDGNGATVDAVTSVNGSDQTVHFKGSHVICTLPLGVLKAGSVAFDPALPDSKLGAIQRVGFGHFEKVAMSFESAFWEHAHPRRTYFYFRSASVHDPMEFPFFLDLQKPLGVPALVGIATGDFGQQFGLMSQDQIRTRVMQILTEAYGDLVTEPTDLRISGWGQDPFANGSYSYLSVASTPDDMDTLAAPVGDRLLFAGEATYKARYGYADGALSSGLREAQRLLGTRPAVIKPGQA